MCIISRLETTCTQISDYLSSREIHALQREAIRFFYRPNIRRVVFGLNMCVVIVAYNMSTFSTDSIGLNSINIRNFKERFGWKTHRILLSFFLSYSYSSKNDMLHV